MNYKGVLDIRMDIQSGRQSFEPCKDLPGDYGWGGSEGHPRLKEQQDVAG